MNFDSSFFAKILTIRCFSDAIATGRLVDPSLEFGLEISHHNNNDDNHGRRRSSVSGVILNLGHEIQRVPDLVVNEAKKVIFFISKLKERSKDHFIAIRN